MWAHFCSVISIFRENLCRGGRSFLVGPNLNCIFARTVKGYDIFKTKFALETPVTSLTACLESSSVSSSKFRRRKRDLTAVQRIQLRARTHTHTNLITMFSDLLPENVSVQIKVKLPLFRPWRYRSTHS